jgi:hypothetical protein
MEKGGKKRGKGGGVVRSGGREVKGVRGVESVESVEER